MVLSDREGMGLEALALMVLWSSPNPSTSPPSYPASAASPTAGVDGVARSSFDGCRASRDGVDGTWPRLVLGDWADTTRGRRGCGVLVAPPGDSLRRKLTADDSRSRDGVERSLEARKSVGEAKLSREGEGRTVASGLLGSGRRDGRGMPLGRRLWRFSSMMWATIACPVLAGECDVSHGRLATRRDAQIPAGL